MVKIGDKIRILNQDGQYTKWANKTWTVSDIARSRKDHPGYDEGIGGTLISCEGLPVSLYEWEYEIQSTQSKKKNKGWREKADHTGKAPEHQAVARKGKLKDTLRTPMAKKVKVTPMREEAQKYQKEYDLSTEATKKLELAFQAKVGDLIYVSDLGADVPIVPEGSIDLNSETMATLVIEEDGSIGWYVNPSEDDTGIRGVRVKFEPEIDVS